MIGEPILWTGEAITDAGNWLGDRWTDGLDAIDHGADAAVNAAEDGVDLAGETVNWIGDQFQTARGDFFDALNTVGAPITGAMDAAWDATEKVVDHAPDAAGDALDAVGDAVSAVTDW